MLSHASKGHNLILMISYICRVILNYTMTSLTLCCFVMTLSISLCYSSVVNKHQLLALSVLCIYYGINTPDNHKATKPAFNVGPSSAGERNAI